jgi:glycosyltransferase involved in cell wall biosynthesis
MRLTVGVPVHNAMPYLPEAIESLLGQTHGDFELLVIDDGSTDGSADYLRSLRDPRLTVLTQPNAGLTATLNRMLREVGTGWLVRHDADDVAMPNRVEVIARAVSRNPEAGMFYTRARYHQDGMSFGSFRTTAGPPATLRLITRAGYLLSICHPTVVLNVQKVLSLGGYRFDYRIEDIDLWWRMALAHDIHFLPEVTLGVRLNPGSLSSTGLSAQMVNTLYVQYLLLSELWELEPSPYEEVAPALAAMVPQQRLRFRERIRGANIRLGQRQYLRAAGSMLAALASSPRDFTARALYELGRSGLTVYGEDPLRFVAADPPLWRQP